jgi:hypothetical protein
MTAMWPMSALVHLWGIDTLAAANDNRLPRRRRWSNLTRAIALTRLFAFTSTSTR